MMAFIVVEAMGLNEALLVAMGPIQLLTATFGGIMYLIVQRAEKSTIPTGK